MKQDTKRQLLKVDKEASAAREKAYQIVLFRLDSDFK